MITSRYARAVRNIGGYAGGTSRLARPPAVLEEADVRPGLSCGPGTHLASGTYTIHTGDQVFVPGLEGVLWDDATEVGASNGISVSLADLRLVYVPEGMVLSSLTVDVNWAPSIGDGEMYLRLIVEDEFFNLLADSGQVHNTDAQHVSAHISGFTMPVNGQLRALIRNDSGSNFTLDGASSILTLDWTACEPDPPPDLTVVFGTDTQVIPDGTTADWIWDPAVVDFNGSGITVDGTNTLIVIPAGTTIVWNGGSASFVGASWDNPSDDITLDWYIYDDAMVLLGHFTVAAPASATSFGAYFTDDGTPTGAAHAPISLPAGGFVKQTVTNASGASITTTSFGGGGAALATVD